jgi:L-asparaginase
MRKGRRIVGTSRSVPRAGYHPRPRPASKKRIHLVHTGGTLGMAPVDGALAPGPYLSRLLADVPELSRLAEVDVEILMNVDSTEMGPHGWDRIGAALAARMADYDGFVVVHGTDTMAYTAAALSFSLRGLEKPVILTGSQRPLRAIPTDARTNLVSAVDLARRDVPEVAIFFGRALLRGNRAMKVSAERYDAFESPNYPPLGRVGLDVDLHPDLVRRPSEPFRLMAGFDPAVVYLPAWPGADPGAMDRAVDAGARIVVMGAYGVGNVAGGERGWPGAIARASRRGTVVLLVTQCGHGAVRPHLYAGGRAALAAGAVPGHDLTVEAALVKSMHGLGRGLSGEALAAFLGADVAGELTAADGRDRAP